MKLDVLINQIEQNYQKQIQFLIDEEEKKFNEFEIQLEVETDQFLKKYENDLKSKTLDSFKNETNNLKIKFDILIDKKKWDLLNKIIQDGKSNFLTQLANDEDLRNQYYFSIFNNPKIKTLNIDSISIDPVDFNFISNIIDLRSLNVIKEEKNKNVVFINSNEGSKLSFGEEISISLLRYEVLAALNKIVFGSD